MRTVWLLCAVMLASCAGKAESTDDSIDGGGGSTSGGSSGEGGSTGGSGPGGSAGAGGWSGHAGMGGGIAGSSGWSGAAGTGPGGSGPCGGFEACPGNFPAIVCSSDHLFTLTCATGESCPSPMACQQFCASCRCHVAPPVSGNLLAGCDKCVSDTDCGAGLACREDPALIGSGAKACVMK